jgi:hypothetical protein
MASLLHQTLLAQLADIERQLQDTTLSHSDQQLLDQAWEDVNNRLDELEILFETQEESGDWRDAAAYLDSESEDSRPATPVPAEPVRFAPPPPPRSVTMQSGLNRRGEIVSRLPGEPWRVVPPPIGIPVSTGPTGCPPPPRPAGVPVCNCDSDGQCAYCEEERWNTLVDDRDGCARCSGCHYCQGYGYDGADEV